VDNLFETTPEWLLRYRIWRRRESGAKVDEDMGKNADRSVEYEILGCARDDKFAIRDR
jgi:hypothetical protein